MKQNKKHFTKIHWEYKYNNCVQHKNSHGYKSATLTMTGHKHNINLYLTCK